MQLQRNLILVTIALGLTSVLRSQTLVEAKHGSPAPTSSSPALDTKSVAVSQDYQIGADDILSVNVWDEAELSKTVPVRPDGKITLPLIGDVVAAGKSTVQLQQELHDLLMNFIAVPEVTVIVQEVKSVRFNIVGEVIKPGSYPLSESVTILDAIAQAGGLGVYAKQNSIYVLRVRPDGTTILLPFRYKQVLKGQNQAQNIRLLPKDTVVVP